MVNFSKLEQHINIDNLPFRTTGSEYLFPDFAKFYKFTIASLNLKPPHALSSQNYTMLFILILTNFIKQEKVQLNIDYFIEIFSKQETLVENDIEYQWSELVNKNWVELIRLLLKEDREFCIENLNKVRQDNFWVNINLKEKSS